MPTNLPINQDRELFERMAGDDVKAFEYLFRTYYKELCLFSVKYVNNPAVAEELVSGLFSSIWEKRKQLQISVSLKTYLYSAAKNASFNYLKSQYARQQFHSDAVLSIYPSYNNISGEIDYQQLQEIIEKGIDTLPARCKIIFNLSRNAGMSYEEIATELGISRKTVKAQMGIALHKLRIYINKYWDMLLVVLLPLL